MKKKMMITGAMIAMLFLSFNNKAHAHRWGCRHGGLGFHIARAILVPPVVVAPPAYGYGNSYAYNQPAPYYYNAPPAYGYGRRGNDEYRHRDNDRYRRGYYDGDRRDNRNGYYNQGREGYGGHRR